MMPHRVANGGVKTVEVHSSPISIGDRQILFSIINDVTEHQIMEGALRDSEEKFRHLFEMESDALFMIDRRDGKIIEANGAAERLYGYSRSEMLQMKNTDFSAEPEETRRATVEAATDIPLRHHRKKDGTRFPLEITTNHFEWNGIPIILCAMRDITERKKAEEVLQESEDKYRLLVQNANMAIVVLQDGMTKLVNPVAIKKIGFPEEVLRSRPFISFVHPEDRAMVMERYQKRLQGTSSPDHYEVRIRTNRGDVLWAEIHVVAIIWDGHPAALNFINDITERKQLEKALHEANRKLHLLSNITRHDITNQLLVLKGRLALLEREKPGSSRDDHLQKAEAAAAQISSLVQFTKEYEDIGIKAPAWVSPGGQTEEAFAMLHPTGVELKDDTDGVEILADPLAEKVPYNLIDNSVRHGEHVTRIKMSAEQRGDAMLIMYEDDGVGISAEDKKRLFEKSFGKNTGFGLFLCREILAITGITITETGKAGEGVRFEMLVPPGAWRLPIPQIEQ